jgi:hypothetical protein
MITNFPAPWRIVELPNGFAVEDATGKQIGVFYGGTPDSAGYTGIRNRSRKCDARAGTVTCPTDFLSAHRHTYRPPSFLLGESMHKIPHH